MKKTTYLLDSNIVIKIWRQYPNLLREIEKNQWVDFKVSKGVAVELSQKEYHKYKGMPVLSDKFLNLLNHVIEDEDDSLENIFTDKTELKIKYNPKTNIYIINENKLSENDFKLIYLCFTHDDLVLVTEDKKILNCGRLIISSERILGLKEFLKVIKVHN